MWPQGSMLVFGREDSAGLCEYSSVEGSDESRRADPKSLDQVAPIVGYLNRTVERQSLQ